VWDRHVFLGAFLYLTKNQYNEGALVLYGRLLKVRKFSGRYWPSGSGTTSYP
jgi:hypothetical protein